MKEAKVLDESLLNEVLKEGTEDLRRVVQDEVYEVCAVEEKESELTKINLDCVPIDLPLSCPLYVRVADKFIMFRRQGDKITSSRIVQLQDKKVGVVYIRKLFWEHFLRTLEEVVTIEPVTPEIKMKHLRRLLVAYGEELDRLGKQPKKDIFLKIQKQAHILAEEISKDHKVGMKCVHRNTEPATYFVNHAVNSAVFSALIGRSVGFSFNDLKQLTYAALVHDVGNVFIPKRILYKKGTLSDEEWKTMQTHTTRGAELLQSVGSPPLVVAVAYQHHERVNGRGYPRKLKGSKIHHFAKIVAIADVFDAILSNRPHQGGQRAQEAIRRMTAQEGLFDPKFLSTIFRSLK